MKKRVFSNNEIDEMIKLYDDGASIFDLQKHFHTGAGKIKSILIEFGINVRTNSEQISINAKKKFDNSVNKSEVIEYYKNHSNKNTCKVFNITEFRLNQILDEYEVVRHTKEEVGKFRYEQQFITTGRAPNSGKKVIKKDGVIKMIDENNLPNALLNGWVQSSFFEGHTVWNKGLTKYTDDRVKNLGNSIALSKDKAIKTMEETNLARYGHKYPIMYAKRPNKMYVEDDLTFDSSYEVIVYHFFKQLNCNLEHWVPLTYEFNDKCCTTFIDFKVNDMLIEVKGSHLLHNVFNNARCEKKIDVYKNNNIIVITDYDAADTVIANDILGVDINLFKSESFDFSLIERLYNNGVKMMVSFDNYEDLKYEYK